MNPTRVCFVATHEATFILMLVQLVNNQSSAQGRPTACGMTNEARGNIMCRFFCGLLLILIAGCQQVTADQGTFNISVTGDLVTNMEGARTFTSYNNIESMPESITIGLTRGSGNNMAIFTLTLPPEPELKTYSVISAPRNPQFQSTIHTAQADLFYANGTDSRQYTENVTGALTFTEVGDTLSGSFEATLFLSLPWGKVDNSRQIDIDGTFSVPNPRR